MTDGDPTSDGENTPYTEVPHRALSSEALRGLVEEFVTRDGTYYGEREPELEEKVAEVIRQLESGEARIVIDSETESVTLLAVEPAANRS